MTDATHASEPLAIVGMSCRLPGGDGLTEFWNLVRTGGTAWGPLPESRLNRELYFDAERGKVGKTYSEIGAVVSDRPIDTANCPIPDSWFDDYDPAHLIVCEVVTEALRSAGYDPFKLRDRNVGVYIGHTGGSAKVADAVYSTCVPDMTRVLHDFPALARLGESGKQIADSLVKRIRNRYPAPLAGVEPDLSGLVASVLVSKLFGLTGPHLVVDAACASSFQALALASRALRQGRINMAIVGGASYCKSDSLVLFSQAHSVSNTGSCPFSANADGLITAEGYVMFAIKTLSQAVADGDNIQSVIRGIGVSSDGKGKSLWAPRQEGQILAVHRAYQGGLDFKTLQYIEAHATSTQVGDATELGALSTALQGRLPPGVKIPIGSIKGNVGHTLETAGVAGMLKTILSMQHETIPPNVQNGGLNREVVWNDCPFYVPFEAKPWHENAQGGARRAAVNAFGIGGLNVHVILDEYRAPATATSLPGVATPTSTTQAVAAAELSEDDSAVAIVGAGCVLPGAFTLEAFWNLLAGGASAISPAPDERFDVNAFVTALRHDIGAGRVPEGHVPMGGFIQGYQYDWRRHKVPPKQVAQANPLQFMLLDAADQAFNDGGFHEKTLDRTRVGVVVGARFGGDFSNQLQLGIRLPEFNIELDDLLTKRGVPSDQLELVREEFRKKLMAVMPSLIDETGSFTSSTLASRITKTFDLKGGALAIDAGSCGSLAALQSAVDILREGSCDMVVCAAGQRSMDSMAYVAAGDSALLSSAQLRGTFDAEAQGSVPAEGCGVVLLKRLSDARRDGDKIRAVIRGVAAFHANDSIRESIGPAMQNALTEAGLAPESVIALEPAACGNPAKDRIEARAIRGLFAKQARHQPLWLSGLRGQIGDLGATAGMASIIKAALSLENHVLPPTLNVAGTIAELDTPSGALQVATSLLKLPQSESAYAAIGLTATEGQLSYHAIIDNGLPRPAITPSRAEPQAQVRQASLAAIAVQDAPSCQAKIIRCEAESLSELAQQLARWSSQPEPAWRSSLRNFSPKGQWRCALVATCPETLGRKSAMAAASLRAGQAHENLQDQGIFVARRPRQRPGVAMLFPGQGSQYLGMLKDLCLAVPAARAALEWVDGELLSAGLETFAELAWNDGERLGKDIWHTQASMLVSNLIGFRTLRSVLPQPDMIAAHSFGEFPGLVAAGTWNLATAAKATRLRCTAVAKCAQARGAMLSVFDSYASVQQMISAEDQVWLSADNGPDQVVVGGLVENIERFGQRLNQRGVKSRYLAVPCPFHTPLLADACPGLELGLRNLNVDIPTTPFASGTFGRFISDPGDIRQSLVKQLVQPVQFRTVVENLYSAGAEVLIEVGPNSVLTQLAKRTLADKSNMTYLHLDHKGRSGAEQWLHVNAGLEVLDLQLQSGDSQQHTPVATAVTHSAATQFNSTQSTDTARPVQAPAQGRLVRFDATARRREAMRSAAGANMLPRPGTHGNTRSNAQETSNGSAGSNGASLGNGSPHSNGASRGNGAPRDNGTAQKQAGRATHGNGAASSNGNGRLPSQDGANASGVVTAADPQPSVSTDGGNNSQPANNGAQQFVAAANPQHAAQAHRATATLVDTTSHGTGTASTTSPSGEPTIAAELKATLVAFIVDQTGYPEEIVELNADLEADLGIDSIKKAQLFGELGERFRLQVDTNMTLDDFTTLQAILDYLLKQPNVVGHGAVQQSPAAADPTQPQAMAAPAVDATAFGPTNATGQASQVFSSEPASQTEPPAYSGVTATLTPPATQAQPENQDDLGLEALLIDFVVEQTGYPAEIVDMDADLEADLGIDSIKKAQLFGEIGERFHLQADPEMSLDSFPTLGHVHAYVRSKVGPAPAIASSQPNITDASAEPTAQAVATPQAAAQPLQADAYNTLETMRTLAPTDRVESDTSDLEQVLVNFVVEQTGYPAEIVDLDADLESDLGIDSIKKAQLFGEIGEQYQLAPDPSLSLNDFATLRHVMNYMQATLQLDNAPSASATPITENDANPNQSATTQSGSGAATEHSYARGLAMGEANRDAIQASVFKMAASGQNNSAQIAFEPTELAELEGLADGGQIAIESLQAWNRNASNVVPTQISCWINCSQPSHQLGILSATVGDISLNWTENQLHGSTETRFLSLPGCLGCWAAVHPAGLFGVVLNAQADKPLPLPIVLRRIFDSCDSVAAATAMIQSVAANSGGQLLLGHVTDDRLYIMGAGQQQDLRNVKQISIPRDTQQSLVADCDGVRELASPFVEVGQRLKQHRRSTLNTQNAWQPIHWTEATTYGRQWQCHASTDNQSTAADSNCGTPNPQTSLDFSYETQGVTGRFVARMQPLPPLNGVSEAVLKDTVVAVIGSGPQSQAVSEQLRQAGARLVSFHLSDDPQANHAGWKQLIEQEKPQRVVLTSTLVQHQTNSDQASWQTARRRELTSLFWMLQEWIVAGSKTSADGSGLALNIVSNGSGDFGLGGDGKDRFAGGLVGLAKAIRNEYPGLQLKAVDCDATDLDASAVVRELASQDAETQVGLCSGVRSGLRPAAQAASTLPAGRTPQPGDAWVISGGARGVTAVVARAIAQRYGVSLHLLGSTQPEAVDPQWLDFDEAQLKQLRAKIMVEAREQGKNPLASWKQLEKNLELAKNMREFAAAGLSPTYHCCDISDWNALEQVLNAVRSESGPVRGILHGAGFESATKFEKKQPDLVETTLSVKVDGAAGLIALTSQDPVDFFISFGSTSGWFGGLGQTDYSLANATLAPQMMELRQQRPNCRASVFHWHAWGEVGMAARPESRFALEAMGLSFMPTAEGVAHVLAELDAGLPEAQVLVTEAKYCPDALDLKQAEVASALQPSASSENSVGMEPASMEPTSRGLAPNTDAQAGSPVSGDADSSEELTRFLVNFVVEQTGYPEEIVELDADLEADLGIDSIKKAQLFGELGERFQLSADSNLSLDDFPTLGHIQQYLLEHVGGGTPQTVAHAPNAAKTSSAEASLVTPAATSISTTSGPAPVTVDAAKAPLIESIESTGHNLWQAKVVLDPASDVFLKEHLLLGQPFLPAVVGLEMILQAANCVSPAAGPLQIEQLEIHNGLRFTTPEPQTCWISIERTTNGLYCELSCDFLDRTGRVVDESRKIVSGLVGVTGNVDLPAWETPSFGYYPFYYVDGAAMYHGPHFRQLEGLLLQHDGGFASLKSPDLAALAAPRTSEGWLTPSATLDSCLVACAVFQYLMFEKRVDIPQAFERLVFIKPLVTDAKYFLRYHFRRRDERNSWYDFCVYDENHQLVLVAENFRCVTLSADSGRQSIGT